LLQSQIFTRHGVKIDRSTLANWVGGACWWLEPLQAKLTQHVFNSPKLFADDTPIPVLDPGRGRTKTGRLWAFARDDRPWSGPEPPAAVYFYNRHRKLNDVEPFAYLKDMLERMSNGHPMSRLDDLLPWHWTSSNPAT